MSEAAPKPISRSFPDVVPYAVFCLRQVYWPLMLVPPIAAFVFGWIYVNGMSLGSINSVESAALFVLGIAFLLGGVQLYRRRDAFASWYVALTFALCCRELHFAGTSTGIYIAIVVLGVFVWLKYPLFADYLAYRWNLTLLAIAMFCYLIAVSLDQHWWKFEVIRTMSTTVEECVEVFGHFFVLLLAVMMEKGNGVLLYPQNQVAKQPTTGARQG